MIERVEKIYSPEEVFAFINEHYDRSDKNKRAEFDGHMMKPYSIRYNTFMKKGTTCVCCGLKGDRFYKERSQSPKNYNPNESYHFNLYGVNNDGEEILFTRDHILARALGGKDNLDNMQTMCSTCNSIKSDMSKEEWDNYDHSKSKEENWIPYTYEQVLERANRYGKKVFVITSLDNRFCVSTNLENARKKYPGHTVISYEDSQNV